jgi:multidrug efflux pump subunit AcrB
VKDIVAFAGFDILSFAQKTNAGVAFVSLKDWSERRDPAQDARRTAPAFGALNASFRDGIVLGFNPPPIQGISTTGGFEFYLQDRSGGSLESLAAAANKVVQAASQRPELRGVQTQFSTAVPQYKTTVDRDKAKTLGVPLTSIFDTMQSAFGSLYLRHDAERVRQPLCQRLHALRAHLPRQPVVGVRFPPLSG